MYYQILEPHPSHPVKTAIQAGAELCQAQVKLEVIDEVLFKVMSCMCS